MSMTDPAFEIHSFDLTGAVRIAVAEVEGLRCTVVGLPGGRLLVLEGAVDVHDLEAPLLGSGAFKTYTLPLLLGLGGAVKSEQITHETIGIPGPESGPMMVHVGYGPKSGKWVVWR